MPCLAGEMIYFLPRDETEPRDNLALFESFTKGDIVYYSCSSPTPTSKVS